MIGSREMGRRRRQTGQQPVESPGAEHSQEPTPWREELKSIFSHTESQLKDDLSWGGGTLALEFVPREGMVVG